MGEPVVVKNFQIDPRLQLMAMESEDELGKIARVHIEMDRHLKLVIAELFPDIKLGNQPRFSTMCQIIRAARFPSGLIELLELFNRLRNNFSHRTRHSLAEDQEIVNRIVALGHEAYNILDEVVINFKIQSTGDEKKFSYAESDEINKIVIIGMMGVSILASIPETKKFVEPITVIRFSNLNW